jgi:type IV pilus assembly protein PilO
MSSTALVPPPNSSSLTRHVPRLTSRARAMLTEMNLHFAGVTALVVLDLYLIAHLIFIFQGLTAHNAEAMDQQQIQVRSAELAARPLRGLDEKLVQSKAEADAFYDNRLPYALSEVVAELGTLTKAQNVHLSRIQYAYAPVLSGDDALTEIKMDASVSGDYRPVVQFINATERDKLFFLINSINLTGQQTGQVNLRIRLTTYLRAPRPGEMTAEMPTDVPATPIGGTP